MFLISSHQLTQLQFKLFTLNLAQYMTIVHFECLQSFSYSDVNSLLRNKDLLYSVILLMTHIQYILNETVIAGSNKLLYPFTMSSVLKLGH